MYADLHLHTRFSDGTYTPEELLAQAQHHGLRALALTDHDTVEGCAAMGALCAEAGIEFIPGLELATELGDKEVHLLGYGVETSNEPLLQRLAQFQQARQSRVCEMVARLNTLGVPLPPQAVFNLANCRSPGRPHVGRALVAGGYCADLNEAFDRYLKRHRPAWVPKAKGPVAHAIDLIHQARGVAVLAHPALNQSDQLIGPLVETGLDGIECFHPKHTASDCQRYLALAKEYGLLVTGGSDCHGMSKGRPTIGTVKLAYEYVEAVKEKLNRLATAPSR